MVGLEQLEFQPNSIQLVQQGISSNVQENADLSKPSRSSCEKRNEIRTKP